ncbi:MAG: hypothetical protein ABII71_00355 [Candidatus Micrarchaeota archaeon]
MIGETMMHVADVVNGVTLECSASSPFWCWSSMAAAALIASSVVLAFLYIWSVLFRNQNLTSYVKLEIYELFVSAIIAILIIGLLGAAADISITTVLPADFLPADPEPGVSAASMNIYTATEQYFVEVDEDMSTWLQLNYLLNIYTDSFASVTPYSRPLGMGIVASPLAGFASPLKSMLYNMTVGLAVAFIINYAQLYTFVFFTAAFLKYYMPMGIFLRCFTPTRRIGGALIGIGVTFLFVYPAISTLGYGMFYNSNYGPMETFRSFMTDYIYREGSVLHLKMREFFETNLTGSATDFASAIFGGIGTLMSRVVGGILTTLMLLPISIIGRAFVLGFVMPTFSILIFVNAGKYLSKSFGEEVDLTQLTRMI